MDLKVLETFNDPYMKTPGGQGAFLAGVLLGYIAYRQVAQPKEQGETKKQGTPPLDKSPLFKQIQFGRLDSRSLKRLMARIPQIVSAYSDSLGGVAGSISALCAKAGELLLTGQSKDLGVDGNFAFTIGFTNAVTYFWKIVGLKPSDAEDDEGKEYKEDREESTPE